VMRQPNDRLKTPWWQGSSRGREVVVGQKYVGLTTSWHGLACRDPDCSMQQGTESVGVLLLIHAASDDCTMTW